MTKRVLCVDDAKDDCELYSFILSEAGYEVESTQSFSDALQLIDGKKFDLCVFDLSVLGSTGFEALKKVREIDFSMLIIICSTDARDSIQQQAIQAGAQAFFTKPIDFNSLLETIAELLNSI